MKIVNTEEENLYLQIDLRIFNEIFRKDVTYDNIKSHRKTGFHSVFIRYIFVADLKFATLSKKDSYIDFFHKIC